MIDYSKALETAKNYLADEMPYNKVTLVILENSTIEFELGWVFFYQSKNFLETGDYKEMLVGNAPFIVDREDSSLHITGTSRTTKYYINQYRWYKRKQNFPFKFLVFWKTYFG